MRSIFFVLALCAHWNGEKISHAESTWQELLGKERYRVMRLKGTEGPFIGAYVFTDKKGTYTCAGCSLPLFNSENKYNAGNGWPSFTKPTCSYHVYYLEDWSFGWKCYEVLCRRCNSHLGHVFPDGPPSEKKDTPSLRYCINSISLIFVK